VDLLARPKKFDGVRKLAKTGPKTLLLMEDEHARFNALPLAMTQAAKFDSCARSASMPAQST
jgi:hypothetical protein